MSDDLAKIGDLDVITLETYQSLSEQGKVKDISGPLPVMTQANDMGAVRRKIQFMFREYPIANACMLGGAEFDSQGYLCGSVAFYEVKK